MRYITATILAMAACSASQARDFLPVAGYEGNSHYAVESSFAGFAASDAAIISHGSLPARSLYGTSGIATVAADRDSAVAADPSADGTTVAITGLNGSATYALYTTDGRAIAAGTLAGPAEVSLAGIAPGMVILTVNPAGAPATTFRFIKK